MGIYRGTTNSTEGTIPNGMSGGCVVDESNTQFVLRTVRMRISNV